MNTSATEYGLKYTPVATLHKLATHNTTGYQRFIHDSSLGIITVATRFCYY